MPDKSPFITPKPLRIIVGSALYPFTSPERGLALGFVELGAVLFFAAGLGAAALGPAAPWFLVGAVLAGIMLRAVDLEGCALLVPGGLPAMAKDAYGRFAAHLGAAGILVEQLLLSALAATAAGHYAVALSGLASEVPVADLATVVALAVMAVTWWTSTQGRPISQAVVVRVAVAAALTVMAVVLWAVFSAVFRSGATDTGLAALAPIWRNGPGGWLAGVGTVAFATAGVESLWRLAPDLPTPTIRHLGRVARALSWLAILVLVGGGFAF